MMVASSLSLSASASTSKTTTNGSHSFGGGEWEYSRTVKNCNGTKIGTICYGFDKAAINEDYCWAKGESSCRAGVKRTQDSSYNYGSYKSNWNWSKEEVSHKKNNNTITYKIEFSANYGTISLDSESSSWNK